MKRERGKEKGEKRKGGELKGDRRKEEGRSRKEEGGGEWTVEVGRDSGKGRGRGTEGERGR